MKMSFYYIILLCFIFLSHNFISLPDLHNPHLSQGVLMLHISTGFYYGLYISYQCLFGLVCIRTDLIKIVSYFVVFVKGRNNLCLTLLILYSMLSTVILDLFVRQWDPPQISF